MDLTVSNPPPRTVPARAGDRSVDLPTLRRRTSELLAAGVPLSLLLDLAAPDGPDSAARYGLEGGDVSWLRAC